MNAEDIVRAAIPNASEGLVNYMLWGRTSFPFTSVSARDLYKAASGYKRAWDGGKQLCDLCHIADYDKYTCKSCEDALRKCREAHP